MVSVPWNEDPPVVAAAMASKPAVPEPVVVEATVEIAAIATADDWLHFAAHSGMKGAAKQLAENAAFIDFNAGMLRLSLEAGLDYLRSERSLAELVNVLEKKCGTAPKIVLENALAASETLQQRSHRQRDARQAAAEENFMNNPDVQRLIQQHGAKVVPDSIRPLDE